MLTEFLHLMGDPAHWMFELASGAIFGLVLSPLGRWAWHRALARHDAEAHGDDYVAMHAPGCECPWGHLHHEAIFDPTPKLGGRSQDTRVNVHRPVLTRKVIDAMTRDEGSFVKAVQAEAIADLERGR